MAYELIRALVQKIMQDKILLGLVVIGVLGIIVGGANMGTDEKVSSKASIEREKEAALHAQQAAPPGHPAPPGQPATPPPAAAASPAAPANAIDPKLATGFITWWLTGAMDYHPRTAAESHQQAMGWMTPEGQRDFSTLLWTPKIAEMVTSGQVIAAFQPTAIQAQAINPDGSIVIGVTGTVVIQGQGQAQATSTQFLGNFLVKQDGDGLRVAGLYTRQAPLAIY